MGDEIQSGFGYGDRQSRLWRHTILWTHVSLPSFFCLFAFFSFFFLESFLFLFIEYKRKRIYRENRLLLVQSCEETCSREEQKQWKRVFLWSWCGEGGGSVARLWDAGFWVDLRKGPSSLCCFVVLLKVYWYNGASSFQRLQGTISTIDVPTDWASADPNETSYDGEYPMTSYLYPLLTHTSLLLTVSDQAKGSDPTWSS